METLTLRAAAPPSALTVTKISAYTIFSSLRISLSHNSKVLTLERSQQEKMTVEIKQDHI